MKNISNTTTTATGISITQPGNLQILQSKSDNSNNPRISARIIITYAHQAAPSSLVITGGVASAARSTGDITTGITVLTPFFVIGTEYHKGYTPGTWEELFEIANDYSKNGDYEDTVKKVISDEDLKVEAHALEDVINIPNPTVTIIVYSVFGVIVLGFIALMVFSRK